MLSLDPHKVEELAFTWFFFCHLIHISLKNKRDLLLLRLSISISMCKVLQNRKTNWFYTFWVKKTPTSNDPVDPCNSDAIQVMATWSSWFWIAVFAVDFLFLWLIFYFCSWFLIFCLWECFADGEERERKWVKLEIIKILNARTTITMMWVFFLLKMCKMSTFSLFCTTWHQLFLDLVFDTRCSVIGLEWLGLSLLRLFAWLLGWFISFDQVMVWCKCFFGLIVYAIIPRIINYHNKIYKI